MKIRKRYFEDLKHNQVFLFGSEEHIKLKNIPVGEYMPGGSRVGFINAIRLRDCQTSGFGPKVEVSI